MLFGCLCSLFDLYSGTQDCFTINIDNLYIGNESKYIFVNLKPMFCISGETSMCQNSR